ncbi:helix-turn-helix domain-containing protein [Paenibacillus melissococcoides]|uniref:Helix-turn-helix domain-containing protein n=1 Tax=Paenibacillus melissococcoides TaxID=2912268 RepID=A0ABM9G9K1_9BACL|nr:MULTISPECIES: helix-turn-helix transcriptional regulator [Paenibacillus]MEB9893769.1 helix-turn-helix transcriptional regulator [Bacillus cereus]CAH8248053.1 helix-turn-helix domain-containing protein [Paenibacillus melissococcoides]CAH8718755.1 helix-turn-helix domain-containing protein [Paenibacillus melissococcoides]CAH8719759.1 helix-turn-helix domain-containing protein [Paenibacillus melissococcoides]GIO79536.1 transcriptional regulator [Paenibacillus dendritiformis]
MELAEKIQALMDSKRITKYRLSKETGVSYTGLSKILDGQTKNPQMDSLKSIADFFGVSVDYFTGEEPHQEQHPEWASAKDKRDFKKMLEEDTGLMFDGVPIEDEDREKVMQVLEVLFWDAKKRSKEKFTNNRYKKKSDDIEK